MNVKDGDLSLCTGLSYVYSERNRKHYNLKNAELPKGQYVRGNEDIEVGGDVSNRLNCILRI